ncbi:MAG: hypothetical protein QOE77_1993 [Blastocatellia bacterium]|jgi:hypothetical protein|nr:hypothetical protein [Blastocatellia bacterium]
MKRLLILSFLLAAYTSAQVPVAQTNASKPAPERTADETLAREIDHLAKLAGLPPLKSSNLAPGDADARVWYGFGLMLLEGFAIKRTNNRWRAFHLKADGANPRYITKVARIQLPAPKSGWKNCWRRLTEAGILTLPSGTELPDPDAEGFYVETMADGSYRNFEYTSPEYSESPNAKRMMAIGGIIFEEFGLPRFHVARRSQ